VTIEKQYGKQLMGELESHIMNCHVFYGPHCINIHIFLLSSTSCLATMLLRLAAWMGGVWQSASDDWLPDG